MPRWNNYTQFHLYELLFTEPSSRCTSNFLPYLLQNTETKRFVCTKRIRNKGIQVRTLRADHLSALKYRTLDKYCLWQKINLGYHNHVAFARARFHAKRVCKLKKTRQYLSFDSKQRRAKIRKSALSNRIELRIDELGSSTKWPENLNN